MINAEEEDIIFLQIMCRGGVVYKISKIHCRNVYIGYVHFKFSTNAYRIKKKVVIMSILNKSEHCVIK